LRASYKYHLLFILFEVWWESAKPSKWTLWFFDLCVDESDQTEVDDDDDDNDVEKLQKGKINSKRIQRKKKQNRFDSEEELNICDDEDDDDDDLEIRETTSQFKRSLSIDFKNEKKKIRKDYKEIEDCSGLDCSVICVNEFKQSIPAWGGESRYNNKKIIFTNTCSFDYYLLAIWTTSQINKNITSNDCFNSNQKSIIINMINLISEKKWSDAKLVWLIEICQIEPCIDKQDCYKIDCFGSVYDFFCKHISYIQTYEKSRCKKMCKNNSSRTADYLSFRKENKTVTCNLFSIEHTCSVCKENYLETKTFLKV